MKTPTIQGVAPPPNRTGRYRGELQQDPLAVPAQELTLADIRASLFALTQDALEAIDQRDLRRAKALVRDVQLLGRAIRRLER